MDGVGAADVGDAGFGQTEEAHLSLPDQLADRAGHLFDRHGRIDPVLVEQIDVVGAEPPQRAFDRLADSPAGCPLAAACLPSSMRKPNLVAITTSSRRPLSARPSSSSLVKGP